MLASPRDQKYVDVIEKLTGKPLARSSMMDIEVREDNRPRRDDERRGGRNGRDRGRGGRDGKHRDRRPPDGKYHEHVASMEPTQVADAPAQASIQAEAPRPAEQPRQQREQRPQEHARPRDQQPREQRPREQHGREHQEKRLRENRSQRHHNEQAARPEPVDKSQLPAFLLRPVPVAKAPKPEPADD
jgi:hypothetical protein